LKVDRPGCGRGSRGAMTAEQYKRLAAEAALAELPEAGLIGLGTGSTARLFIEQVAALVRAGRRFSAVATSEESRALGERAGIAVVDDDGPWDILVTVDGADEVDAELNLIKGGGGAHAREKIVNHASRKNVIVVDDSKLCEQLGKKRPIPVEVLRFGHKSTARALEAWGRARLRLRGDATVLTDAGNVIYDLFVDSAGDPQSLERALLSVPGVVETGLFLGRADIVIVSGPSGVRRLKRPEQTQR
jgi:ribose 5-phosphate isomerase A